MTPRDGVFRPRGPRARLWDPLAERRPKKVDLNLKISIMIGVDGTRAESNARDAGQSTSGMIWGPGRGKERDGSVITCPGVWWEEQLPSGRLALPVSGSQSGAPRGARGNAGCDTSSGTGVCGWPLAGPVSQPQTSTHPGSLSFGYSLCP